MAVALRRRAPSRVVDPAGDVLHRGLADALDRTLLMTRPLDVTGPAAEAGLLRSELREQPVPRQAGRIALLGETGPGTS